MDQEKMEAFVGKVLGDTSATMTSFLAILGDRLGLFKDMAANGATTPAELASRTNTNERYAREWLGGMATAGYIDYDPASETFTMPEEHAPALAHEGGPVFFGGVYEMLPPLVGVLDRVEESFKNGGGVHQSEYHPRWWDGMERFTRGWFDNFPGAGVGPGDAERQSKARGGCDDGRCWLWPRARADQACRSVPELEFRRLRLIRSDNRVGEPEGEGRRSRGARAFRGV